MQFSHSHGEESAEVEMEKCTVTYSGTRTFRHVKQTLFFLSLRPARLYASRLFLPSFGAAFPAASRIENRDSHLPKCEQESGATRDCS
jgi:hypothetical protein